MQPSLLVGIWAMDEQAGQHESAGSGRDGKRERERVCSVELGKTDFVEEGRSLKQSSVLDVSKENRLIRRLSSDAGAHSCISTDFQLPSITTVNIFKVAVLEKGASVYR